MNIKWLYLGFLCLSQFFIYGTDKLLIVHTKNESAYNYYRLKYLTESVGFTTDIIHAHNLTNTLLLDYTAVFLLTDCAFIQNQTNPTVKKTIQLLAGFYAQPKKLLGLILPTTNCHNEKYVELITTFLSHFESCFTSNTDDFTGLYTGLIKQVFDQQGHNKSTLVHTLLGALLSKAYRWSYWYDTALLYKFMHKAQKNLADLPSDATVHTVPILKNEQLEPLGFVIKNKDSHAHLLVSTISLVDFYEINEQSTVHPVDVQLRNKLISNIQYLFAELYIMCGNNPQTYTLPHWFSTDYIQQEKQRIIQQRSRTMRSTYNWTDTIITAAWIDIEPFVESKEAMQLGAQALIDAGINLLWITFNVEGYFSRRALYADRQQQFIKNIDIFAQGLKQAYTQAGKELPNLCASFDITTNFREHPTNSQVTDMYGKNYDKIPAPLDYYNLWIPELLEPFDAFISLWAHTGIPLANIFLDLQMYHAQDQAERYSNIMDFSDHSWHRFINAQQDEALLHYTTAEQRVEYLLESKLLHTYLTTLRLEARSIGQKIRQHIRTVLPDALIGVYTPNLAHTWFEQGLLSGLSTAQDPIIYATFNQDAYSHIAHLNSLGIHCFHIPAFLLSKLRTSNDFDLIPKLKSYHDGIWFNRFSRLLQNYNNQDWWHLERSPLPIKEVVAHIGALCQ